MQEAALKFSFDDWLDALRAAGTSGKSLSDVELQQKLSLPSADAAKQLRQRLRKAIHNGAFDFLTGERGKRLPNAPAASVRRYSAAVPSRQKRNPDRPPEATIDDWYAPHRS